MARPVVDQTLRSDPARPGSPGSGGDGPVDPGDPRHPSDQGAGRLASDLLVAVDAAGPLAHAEVQITRFQTALDQVSEGVVICAGDGTEVYRNDAARQHMAARIAGSLTTSAVNEHLATARLGGPTERLLELFLPVRRLLLIRAFPLMHDSDGLDPGAGPERPAGSDLLGAVAIVEDVSERRRVDAIRRDFVANVSHELKTPVGALSLLAETLDGEDDPEIVARLAGRISAEASRLGRLIDDLLDLSRIEANETPAWERVPIHTVVGQSLEAVRPLAEAGGITLVLDEPHGDLAVVGDRWELVSGLTNLVDNAVKYSEPGGRVTVSAVRVNDANQACSVELRVSDRGIGIPRRDLERIFERFYRVDRARSRSTGGTGLGLSIVRHVAANHGGTVRVISEEGVGSTFTLSLPCPPDECPRQEAGA